MKSPRALALALWAVAMLLAVLVVARARYTADLSAFLPRAPTQTQRLLVEQLSDGPASRLVLMAIAGADPDTRARVSHALVSRLRADPQFSFASNGETLPADNVFLFEHRYSLSDAVTPQRFTAAGLRDAVQETLAQLSSPAGLLLKSLVPRDPTGEMTQILTQLQGSAQPQLIDGAWASPDGARALVMARTAAAGSDTDGQQSAIEAIRRAFADGARATPASAGTALLMSSTGKFAVDARASIKREALRLSLLSAALIVLLLLVVYRSVTALLLGLLPVVSGALAGIAAVALGFGVVHGLTLGFGITLIGEAVDYSVYLFVQSQSRASNGTDTQGWSRAFWPTIRLGMLTSICGFAALLLSGFPGLAQLGLYTVAGLVVAALVTRYVLLSLLPVQFRLRDLAPLGERVAALLQRLRRVRWLLALVPFVAAGLLIAHRNSLWNLQLSSLSPVSPAAQRLDAGLRADLGAADVRHIVVVSAADFEGALRGAERVSARLDELRDAGVVGGYDSPAAYLPSLATQRGRVAALPSADTLRANLHSALAGLPLKSTRLGPFLQDVAAARTAAPLTAADLQGTSMALGFDALMIHTGGRWRALLPLRAPVAGTTPGEIDAPRVQAALSGSDVVLLDLKHESDALYSSYLSEAGRLSLLGLLAITVLLAIALRSVTRVLRILAPLLLAVLAVTAGLIATGHALSLLHLVGMLLIVAVGSNYALFFDRSAGLGAAGDQARSDDLRHTLASLVIANTTTVTGFGVLAFSTVPVLQAIGATVAPGALLALLFAALLAQ